MLELCTLASGSSGNCLLATDGKSHILVDAGISARRICTALQTLRIDPGALDGILITHEHTDHMSGLANFLKRFPTPVRASAGTAQGLLAKINDGIARTWLETHLDTFQPGDTFEMAGIGVGTFKTSHDARQSTGFTLSADGRKAAVATDLGCLTPAVLDGVRGCDLIVAEANHDIDMLAFGPYPAFLKERIASPYGHLSNRAGAELVCEAVSGGARTVVLAHLSAKNNTPEQALQTVHTCLEQIGAHRDVLLEVAPRAEASRWYQV